MNKTLIGKKVRLNELRFNPEADKVETVTIEGIVLWSEKSRGKTLYAIEGTGYLYHRDVLTVI